MVRGYELKRAKTGGGPLPEMPEYFETIKDILGRIMPQIMGSTVKF